MFRKATTLLILPFLFVSTSFSQEGRPAPQGEGGGIKVGPSIIIPFMLIPAIIKKLTERGELPKYPTLEKKPLNISQSGNTYVVDWVVYYANNTNAVQNGITITEGPINTVVPGSLQQPFGWSGALNSTNTIATWTGSAPPVNGYMSININTSVASSFNVTGGGDGYRAIPYRHMSSGGKLRIYFINHHEPMGANTNTGTIFKCVDTATGNYCPGFPKLLPKGDNSGKFSSSGMYDEEYFIDGTGRLYYAVTGSDMEFGLGCYNLETDTECGFYKLGTNPTKTWSYVKGPWKVGNEFYMVGGDLKLYCLSATNPANFCTGLSSYYTGFSFPLASFTDPNAVGVSLVPPMSVGPGIFGEVVGNKLYFITDSHANAVPKTIRAFCYDAGAKSACAGWTVSSQTHTLTMTYPRVWSSFIYYDNTMSPKYVCTRLNQFSQYCFNLSNGLPASPPTLFGTLNLNTGLGSEVTIGSRTYFTDFMYQAGSFNPGRVLCWDWVTGAPCMPTWEYKSWTHGSNGNPRDYTTNVDDRGCIWVLGDNAPAMWYFDPTKPPDKQGFARRCDYKDGKIEQVFKPWDYCSGPKPFLWLRLEVINASLSDFNKLEIKVKDVSNNTLLTYDCIANNSTIISLSSIASQTNGQPIKVEVAYTLATGANLQNFEVRAYYHASPLEFCFKSKHSCGQGPIKNTVAVAGIESPPNAEVELSQPENCPKMAEGDGGQNTQPTGSGANPSSGSSGGVGAGVGLMPTPLPSQGGAGATLGSSTPTGGGLQIVEKDGTVQILPETKQRCYWRPKQKTTQTAKPVGGKTVKRKENFQQKPNVENKPASKNVVAQKPKSVKKKPTSKPPMDMEYICEPEK